jgi:hypothetical protein
MAVPIPLPPPVMSATFPLSFIALSPFLIRICLKSLPEGHIIAKQIESSQLFF